MRWIMPFPVFLLLLLSSLFPGKPAWAIPQELYFHVQVDSPEIGRTNPGTISYAGGPAPLVGSNISVFEIVRTPALGSPEDLTCLSCTLKFSSGPYAGRVNFPAGPANSFSSGGSLQIIGGVSNNIGNVNHLSLPLGTMLYSGVPMGMRLYTDDFSDRTSLQFTLSGGGLNEELRSHFGLVVDASLRGVSLIVVEEKANPPDSFVLGTFRAAFPGEPSYVWLSESEKVPLPETLWPFAIAFVALAGWQAWRKAFSI